MDALTAIRQPVEGELQRYKTLFEETLCHQDDFLGQALTYIRQRRGKMMRPLLVLLVARECGDVALPALRAAVTLELLHTASLVHDDVVDESDERRGQASANSVYGNKVAVLVGDYLLSMALHQSALTGDIRCVDIIARLGGTLSEGEVQQLANIRKEVVTEEAYFDVIRRKTAEFFGACAQLGAIASGAADDFVAQAKAFGEYVGMCFQVRDDIFDYYDDSAIGKPTGNDMREGKLTLPAIYALQHSGNAEMQAVALRIKGGEASAEEISRMVQFTIAEGGIDYACRVMDDFRARAAACLSAFHNDAVRTALEGYLNYVIGRES
jgi:octaprenyl-diphosphate synthase